jgi:hypothetical protein
MKKRKRGRPHNMDNDGGTKKRMLDRSRERVFRLELEEILEESSNHKSQGLFAANILNKAAKNSVDDAQEYLGEIKESGDLEPEISEKVDKLLRRYTKRR